MEEKKKRKRKKYKGLEIEIDKIWHLKNYHYDSDNGSIVHDQERDR